MSDAMVTGRMSEQKKNEGAAVLARAGLNASQAINLLFDRLIQEQSVDFLMPQPRLVSDAEWKAANAFLETLVVPLSADWADADRKTARVARLSAKGLM